MPSDSIDSGASKALIIEIMLKFKLQKKIDPNRVAKAIGAEPVGIRSPRPMDIIDVRESLKKVLAPKPSIGTSLKLLR